MAILFTIKIKDGHDFSYDSTLAINLCSLTDHIDKSQLNAVQLGVCLFQD